MSEPEICVCGHAEESHQYDGRNEFGCDECGHAKCDEYHPCVPWPTEAGLWWCDKFRDRTCTIMQLPGQSYHVLGAEGHNQWFNRREFEELLGPARFVKLQEQSPFPAH